MRRTLLPLLTVSALLLVAVGGATAAGDAGTTITDGSSDATPTEGDAGIRVVGADSPPNDADNSTHPMPYDSTEIGTDSGGDDDGRVWTPEDQNRDGEIDNRVTGGPADLAALLRSVIDASDRTSPFSRVRRSPADCCHSAVNTRVADEIDDTDGLPATAGRFTEEYPEVWNAYSGLRAAAATAGPIDGETKRLVKLALAVGAQSEGAVHSHVRRGLKEAIDPETLRHVAVLGIPTLGFPAAMATDSRITDLTE